MKEKTKLGKFFEKIGEIFKGIFNKAEKAWSNLPDEVQDSFIKGSEILSIINNNLYSNGGFLFDIIKEAYPDLDIDKFKQGLNKAILALNLGAELSSEPTIEEMLQTLSNHLKSQDKELWAAVSSLASKIIAHSLSGNLISWATFELLMEFVYQTFIKKRE